MALIGSKKNQEEEYTLMPDEEFAPECNCKKLIEIAENAIKKADILLNLVIERGITTSEQSKQMKESNKELRRRVNEFKLGH